MSFCVPSQGRKKLLPLHPMLGLALRWAKKALEEIHQRHKRHFYGEHGDLNMHSCIMFVMHHDDDDDDDDEMMMMMMMMM